MSWLHTWFGAKKPVSNRWIVLDVETTGMDTSHDSLLCIGAVAIVDGRIRPADSIELYMRPHVIGPRENTLIHGIGQGAQARAQEPRLAWMQFLDYAGQAPLLAFHAAFDRAFIGRAVKAYLNQLVPNRWLDVAQLASAVYPQAQAKSLDEWAAFANIAVHGRHTAGGDTLTTALLLQRLVRASGFTAFEDLRRLAGQARWMA